MTRPTDAPTCDLLGSDRPLAATYDVALLDLDGVCFAGAARVPHAAEGVNDPGSGHGQECCNDCVPRGSSHRHGTWWRSRPYRSADDLHR